MGGNKHVIKSDLARIDRHEITAEEYAEIPELDDEFFERADLYEGDRLIKRGRPKSEAPKVPINIRLSPDVVERFKASGPGWQTRIDAALKVFIEEHPERV
ncbi:BrnA antitoxin family protein [Salinarimonas chemoclinalis]|uniref:BrnA antitoxin family protein n=1 Tax=Salinarimonas chemoclinalis TaxID=3241599 RepID=UPI003556ED33